MFGILFSLVGLTICSLSTGYMFSFAVTAFKIHTANSVANELDNMRWELDEIREELSKVMTAEQQLEANSQDDDDERLPVAPNCSCEDRGVCYACEKYDAERKGETLTPAQYYGIEDEAAEGEIL